MKAADGGPVFYSKISASPPRLPRDSRGTIYLEHSTTAHTHTHRVDGEDCEIPHVRVHSLFTVQRPRGVP